jgi:transposase
MKENSVKEKFILLRGEGLSFDKIAKRIKVSKPTLIEWQREFQEEIKEAQEIRFGEILEKYNMIKQKGLRG